MSPGTSSTQILKSNPSRAFLAKASATLLQHLDTWLNLWDRSCNVKWRMSSTMWPYSAGLDRPLLMAWLMIAESPSKMISWRPRSTAKDTAWQQARASTFGTEWGSRIRTDIASSISPHQSLITTPSPAVLLDLKTAPS